MTKCVITGNPVDGIFVYGPFITPDDASRFAETEHDGQDWWVTDLTVPETQLPSREDLLQLLDDVSAMASNMVHLAPEPARIAKIQEVRDLCDRLLRSEDVEDIDEDEDEDEDDDAYDDNGNLRAGDN